VKKINFLLLVFTTSLLAVYLSGCNKTPNAAEENSYIFKVPAGWPNPEYSFEGNEVTEAKFVLGRTLFYDGKLSLTNNVSCGTCHQPFAAFAQIDHDISHGIFDRTGKRNSPPLFNLNWHKDFFWDGRVNHIELQPLNPIADSTEMGETLVNVIRKLNDDPKYAALYNKAFGSDLIDSQRTLKALAVFMGMMISNNAKYDHYLAGTATFSDEEQRGMLLFNQHCEACHKPPLFSDFSFRSNGLSLQLSAHGTIDSGKAAVAPFSLDNMYKFKVPSLRNLKFTRPYMHDGRFQTLEQVLDHYANIDGGSPNLDPLLRNSIVLNPQQRSDLLAFLNTLDDESFVRDKRFHQQ
jgi:cytochrome c peroxidase